MSVAVELDRIRDEVARYGLVAFLATVSADARPHLVSVPVAWENDTIVVEPGNRSTANASAHPLVSLLWPPVEGGGYSLIVDCEVRSVDAPGGGGNRLSLAPTKAVLHRNAAASDAGGSGSDCVTVFRSEPR